MEKTSFLNFPVRPLATMSCSSSSFDSHLDDDMETNPLDYAHDDRENTFSENRLQEMLDLHLGTERSLRICQTVAESRDMDTGLITDEVIDYDVTPIDNGGTSETEEIECSEWLGIPYEMSADRDGRYLFDMTGHYDGTTTAVAYNAACLKMVRTSQLCAEILDENARLLERAPGNYGRVDTVFYGSLSIAARAYLRGVIPYVGYLEIKKSVQRAIVDDYAVHSDHIALDTEDLPSRHGEYPLDETWVRHIIPDARDHVPLRPSFHRVSTFDPIPGEMMWGPVYRDYARYQMAHASFRRWLANPHVCVADLVRLCRLEDAPECLDFAHAFNDASSSK